MDTDLHDFEDQSSEDFPSVLRRMVELIECARRRIIGGQKPDCVRPVSSPVTWRTYLDAIQSRMEKNNGH